MLCVIPSSFPYRKQLCSTTFNQCSLMKPLLLFLALYICLGSLQAQRRLKGWLFMEAQGAVILKELRGYSLGLGYGYHLNKKWSFRLGGNYEYYGYGEEVSHFIYNRVDDFTLDTISVTVLEEARYENFFLDGSLLYSFVADGTWFLNTLTGLKVGLEEVDTFSENSQKELQAGIILGLEAEVYLIDELSFFGFGRIDLWLRDGFQDLPKLGVGFRVFIN